MFIFKHKEIYIYDYYAPFIPPVTPDKTKFMFLTVSLTLDTTSGFFQYRNSDLVLYYLDQHFQQSFTMPDSFESWPSHFLSEGTAGPSERHK